MIKIDGKSIAAEIRRDIQKEVEALRHKGVRPGLAVLLVGDDPASTTYVGSKEKACQEAGIYSEVYRLPVSVSEADLLELLEQLNRNQSIHGILVQLPLPQHIDADKVIDCVRPEKDVDGFHPVNVGRLSTGKREVLVPCTPLGVMELLRRSNVEVTGKHAVIVGRSNIVGKPVAQLLLQQHATVTVCHSRTANLSEVTRQADILVVAIGSPEIIRAEHVKPGCVVVDVGINRTPQGKLVGDVAYEEVSRIASAITPVPGGVGPMTIAMLLKNTVQAAKAQTGVRPVTG